MSTTSTNQFALLGQRRFAPFFWTQFLGAANDNLFKFALTVMVTYQLQLGWLPPAMGKPPPIAVPLIAAITGLCAASSRVRIM